MRVSPSLTLQGGIIQLVQITISDLVSLKDRGKYAGLIGMTWGFASAIGPVIGGALAEKASWRWVRPQWCRLADARRFSSCARTRLAAVD